MKLTGFVPRLIRALASLPGNGGRGLKQRVLVALGLGTIASLPGNGGRGLKLAKDGVPPK